MSQNWSGRARARRPRGFSRLFSWGSFSWCCEFLLAVRAQGWAERHDGIGFQRCHRTGQDEREHGGREDVQGCFHGCPFLGVVSFFWPYGHRGGQNGMMGSAFSDVTELVRTSASTAAARMFKVVFMGVLFLVLLVSFGRTGTGVGRTA